MVAILRAADRSPIAEIARKHKISEQTIYVWRKRFGKLEPADERRLRELETANGKLKRMVAEREKADLLVPREGIEPSWPCDRQILSLLRIPVPPPGRFAGTAALPRAGKGGIIA
jgi:putative transposase